MIAPSSGRIFEWVGVFVFAAFGLAAWFALRRRPDLPSARWTALASGICIAGLLIVDLPYAAIAALFFGLGFIQWLIYSRAGLKVYGWARLIGFGLVALSALYEALRANGLGFGECGWCGYVALIGFVGAIAAGYLPRQVLGHR